MRREEYVCAQHGCVAFHQFCFLCRFNIARQQDRVGSQRDFKVQLRAFCVHFWLS